MISQSSKTIDLSNTLPANTPTNTLGAVNTGTYIIADSDKVLITKDLLDSLTINQINIAKNEIYARHGYIFTSPIYKNYFSSQPWYKENPNYSASDLNSIEKQNILIIVNYFQAKEIKKVLLTNQ